MGLMALWTWRQRKDICGRKTQTYSNRRWCLLRVRGTGPRGVTRSSFKRPFMVQYGRQSTGVWDLLLWCNCHPCTSFGRIFQGNADLRWQHRRHYYPQRHRFGSSVNAFIPRVLAMCLYMCICDLKPDLLDVVTEHGNVCPKLVKRPGCNPIGPACGIFAYCHTVKVYFNRDALVRELTNPCQNPNHANSFSCE